MTDVTKQPDARDAFNEWYQALPSDVHRGLTLMDAFLAGATYRQQSCKLGPICLGCEPKEECKPTGWQPIETAPKDGTSIDLWVVNKHYPDSAHRVPDAQWKYEQWSVVYTDETGWDYVDVEGPALKATHWMPIPNGPEKS